MRIGLDARYAFRKARRGIGEYVAALLGQLPAVAGEADTFVLYVDRNADVETLPAGDVLADVIASATPVGARPVVASRIDRPAPAAAPTFVIRRLPVSNPLVFEEFALPRAAARDGLDLLHLTANYGPSYPPCPTVYTVHDVIEFIRPTFSRARLAFRHAAGRAIRIRTLPRQARRARRLITVSAASRDDIVRIMHVHPETVEVVPLAVSPTLAPAANPADARAALRAAGHPVPERYVLAFGAMDPRKNGPFLMRAFAEARARGGLSGIGLWVVGVERPEEYPVPVTPKPDWLTLRGFTDRATLLALLQGATGFVYPSLYEGFGLPVLEAMACGVPVFASNRSSIPEVAGDAAVLFDPSDLNALTDALCSVLPDAQALADLRHRGVARAAQFTWQEVARRTMAVYRRAVANAANDAA